MNSTSYSPAKEFIGDLWSDKIKPWLDFKSYLAQRHRILADPAVILTTSIDNHSWKSPLKFALQGLAVPTLLISLIVGIYSFVAQEAEPTWKQDQRELIEALTALRKLEIEIKAAPPTQTFTFIDDLVDRPRDDALKECQRRIAKTESQQKFFSVAPFVDAAEGKLSNLLAPTMLIIAAYFFGGFLKTGQGRSGSNMNRASEIYLYFATSSTFWLGLGMCACAGIRMISHEIMPQLEGIFFFGYIVLGLIGLVILNRDSKKLQEIFDLPLLEGKNRNVSGHHKIFSAIIYANFVSSIIAFILYFISSWCWGLTTMWISRIRA